MSHTILTARTQRMPKKIIAGNWKMNGGMESLSMIRALVNTHPNPKVGVLICPPAPLLSRAVAIAANGKIEIGAQNCHHKTSGAHTGDISAGLLADIGCKAVILGHSERRTGYGETGRQIGAKVTAAHSVGMTAIVCVGEACKERNAGAALKVIGNQVETSLPPDCTGENLVVAYEPVWAIGTGSIPNPLQIQEAHECIREHLVMRFDYSNGWNIPILYGGSVNGENAPKIFATKNVDGALVGGSSLRFEDFSPIVSALETSVS